MNRHRSLTTTIKPRVLGSNITTLELYNYYNTDFNILQRYKALFKVSTTACILRLVQKTEL